MISFNFSSLSVKNFQDNNFNTLDDIHFNTENHNHLHVIHNGLTSPNISDDFSISSVDIPIIINSEQCYSEKKNTSELVYNMNIPTVEHSPSFVEDESLLQILRHSSLILEDYDGIDSRESVITNSEWEDDQMECEIGRLSLAEETLRNELDLVHKSSDHEVLPLSIESCGKYNEILSFYGNEKLNIKENIIAVVSDDSVNFEVTNANTAKEHLYEEQKIETIISSYENNDYSVEIDLNSFYTEIFKHLTQPIIVTEGRDNFSILENDICLKKSPGEDRLKERNIFYNKIPHMDFNYLHIYNRSCYADNDVSVEVELREEISIHQFASETNIQLDTELAMQLLGGNIII